MLHSCPVPTLLTPYVDDASTTLLDRSAATSYFHETLGAVYLFQVCLQILHRLCCFQQ